jgi:hypothetical protein
MPTNQSSFNGILMESMVSMEKQLGAVEKKISVIFTSINNIMEYSSKSGSNLLSISADIRELKENLIYKEDLIAQLAIIHDEISEIIKLMNKNNQDIMNTLGEIISRLNNLDEDVHGIKNQESSTKKGIFKR